LKNNVRSKIVKEHLNDPAYYERISALLDEIIRARKQQALDYEVYLRRMADLVNQLERGKPDGIPTSLDTPGRRALFNNLEQNEALALRIDAAVKANRPAGWRGVETKERVIKGALFGELQDKDEVERIFLIIKAQPEY
jgi:type I restriction enzyme R subunit